MLSDGMIFLYNRGAEVIGRCDIFVQQGGRCYRAECYFCTTGGPLLSGGMLLLVKTVIGFG